MSGENLTMPEALLDYLEFVRSLAENPTPSLPRGRQVILKLASIVEAVVPVYEQLDKGLPLFASDEIVARLRRAMEVPSGD